MEDLIRERFNQVLIRHYERLTGSKNVPGGLPLSLENIGCLILFGGRELEMSDITSEVSERYTMEEFLREIADAGIEDNEYFRKALQEMIDKKYIEQLPDGHIHGYSDTKETARILNRIFPKMQGLNMLAYIWQTIAEVATGRTDPESAISRFDQTLSNHGVVPPKPKIPTIKPDIKPQIPSPAPEKKEMGEIKRSSRIIRDYVVADTASKNKPAVQKPAEQTVLVGKLPEEQPSEIRMAAESEQENQEEAAALQQKIPELEKIIGASEKEVQLPVPPPEAAEPGKTEEPVAVSEEVEEEKKEPVDDEIARKIAAFEKELALVCPVCKTGILQEKSTAAGKVFYACGSGTCNFISWGKPHNVTCARCKNPFLVEVADAAGQIFLRCPRATCQHRQPLNPEGVKLVRKRLVRRRK